MTIFSKILIAGRGKMKPVAKGRTAGLQSRRAGRALGALAALGCIGTSQPPAKLPPVVVPPQQGHFSFRTLPLDRALALFRTICMDSRFDGEAIERAVLAAGLDYARQTVEQPGEMLWTSRYGEVYFRGRGAMRDGRPMQDCDLRFAIPERLERRRLAGKIGRVLAPGRRRVDVDLVSIWEMGGNSGHRLQVGRFSPDDTRLIDLNWRHIDSDREH